MDEENPPGQGGGGFTTKSSLYSPFGSGSSSLPVKSEAMAPSSLPPSATGTAELGRFSQDISRMPDFPPRNVGHRRAQSEILGLPDDISFDSDLGIVGCLDGPFLSDETEEGLFPMYIDLEKFNSLAETSVKVSQGVEPRSIVPHAPSQQAENIASSSSEKAKVRHQHSISMDGSTFVKPELLGSGSEGPSTAEAKKVLSAAKLADLSLVDPKRAKRIWANRQSAARSKERKMRYIAELERKVQTLHTEATTMSAQLTMLQRDNNGLTAENNELKLRLQNIEQQVHLQDALNDALREEVQRLKLTTGQMGPSSPMMNFTPSLGANKQFYHHNQAMHSLLAAQQLQQLQIHSQHHQPPLPHQHHPHCKQNLPVELKMKGAMTFQNQREGTSDTNSNPN